jgi:hypothetical protein
MDILNFIYLKTAGLIRSKANDPDTDLIAVGANVGPIQRGDSYQTYAMPIKDLVESGCEANTVHYELDITQTSTVTVTTPRGIIDILGMGSSAPLTPDPAYATSVGFYINNLDLNLTAGNRDNIYVQYSIYYSQDSDDNAIPYLIATGATPLGLGFNLYNANPAAAGTNNWEGALYVYYELYQIN